MLLATNATIVDLVISSGQQNSNALPANAVYSDAVSLNVGTPSGAAETFKFQTSYDNGSSWFDVEDGDGNLVTLPAAGQARSYYDLVSFPMLRIRSSSGAVAAERTFKITKHAQG